MNIKRIVKGRCKGTGSIIKRRGHFFLRTTVQGKRVERLLLNSDNLPCTTKGDAIKSASNQDLTLYQLDSQEKIVEKVAEIRHLKVVHQAKSSDIWRLYINSADRPDTGEKTLASQKRLLEQFAEWVQQRFHCGMDGVTSMIASEFLHEIGEKISNKTFNEYSATLRLIFRVVYKQLGMTENPFEGIRHRPLETVSRKEFTEEQVQKIFDGFRDGFFYETEVEGLGPGRKRIRERKLREFKPLFKDEMEVLMKLCCFSGCDGQSGCLMKWENVDLQANRIIYVRHKTRKKTNGRLITLPIHSVLRDALLNAQTWRRDDSPYILPNVAQRYQRNRNGVQKDAMKIFRCALGIETTTHDTGGCRRALGANIYSLHSFRHTFVSFCANAGVPLAIVAEIVGHGNPAMTRHYTHVNDSAKEKAIDVLPSFTSLEPVNGNHLLSLPDCQGGGCNGEVRTLSANDEGGMGVGLKNYLLSFIGGASRQELAHLVSAAHRLWHLRQAG